jgi:phosphoesterase RecJ-like protein
MNPIQAILHEMSSPNYSTIIIHRHQNPDPDALGSQGGLRELLKTAFPEKRIFSVGEEVPSLSFIDQMDVIPDEFYQGALVIVTDTANTSRISDERYSLGAKLIKIDHHPNDESYGDLNWVDTSFSSCAEMIYYLSQQSEMFPLNETSARLLFTGIVGDTGRFQYNNTKPSTFEAAAKLLLLGFNAQDIYQKLQEEPENVIRFKGYILQKVTISSNGRASVYLTKEELDRFGVDRVEAANLVYILGDIKGIKIWTFFIDDRDQIRVRIRSKGPVINEIAKRFGGGGHPLASGASVQSMQEMANLISALDELL